MASNDMDLYMNKMPDGATMNVHIHYTLEFHVRFWAAIQLIKLAGWLLNCEIEISDG